MNEIHEILARNLKLLRMRDGYTQEALSERAGISKNYLAEIETGRKYPSPDVFLRFAKVFNLRPYMLLVDGTPSALFEKGPSGGKNPARDERVAALVHEVADVIARHLSEDLPQTGPE